MKGKQPYWMSKIMQLYIKPVAAHLGIPLKGWHTLRHSYTTLLRHNGNNPQSCPGPAEARVVWNHDKRLRFGGVG